MTDKKGDLIKLVGSQNVFDEPEILGAYSRDESFAPVRSPRLVVMPENSDQVQEIIKWANRTMTPIVPVSSGPPHFRGDTVPGTGGVLIVDLSRMKRIIRIDRRNRMVIIEPGVTFEQIQPVLAQEGLKISMPLVPRGNKSVIASLLEREPILIPKYQWTLLEPLRCLEVIWGNGSRLWTGDAGPWGSLERQWDMKHAQVMPLGWGQVDYYRLISGAQGTMGIVTWASVKCELLPQVHKILFATSKKLEDLLGLAYKVLKIRYADELFILNNSNLAHILAKKSDQFLALRDKIPSWILVLGLAGRERLPKERVEYQENDIAEIAQEFGLPLSMAIPGARGEEVLNALLTPCTDPNWKLRYKGGCQDIFFLTTLEKTPKFIETMYQISDLCDYPAAEIGVYIQPINRGVGCHCEFMLPYDKQKENEIERIRQFCEKGSREIMRQQGFFSRPYGTWGDLVFSRDAQSTMVLRKIKDIFDPNHVMNPGKLCF